MFGPWRANVARKQIASAGVKRCLECGLASPAVGSLLVGFLGVLAFLALALVSGWLSIVGIVAIGGVSARMFRKGARILYAVNATSDDVEGKSEALPQARLHE